MRYTHTFDFVHRVLLFVGSAVLLFMVVDFLEPAWNALALWNPFEGFDLVLVLLSIAGAFGGLYVAAQVLGRTLLPGWPFTWAYALTSARVRLTADDAERLTPLVNGSYPLAWLNLSKLRKLSREERKPALYYVANRFAKEQGQPVPFPAFEEAMRQAEEADERPRRRAAEEESRRRQHEGKDAGKEQGQDSNAKQRRQGADDVAQALSVLGLSGTRPDFEAVRQAYRKKIADYHPDRFEGKDEALRHFVEERAKAINAAYQVLERAYGVKS